MTLINSLIKLRTLEPGKQRAYVLGLVMIGLIFIPNSSIAAEPGLLDSANVETITESPLIHTLAKNEKNKGPNNKDSNEETESSSITDSSNSEETQAPIQESVITEEITPSQSESLQVPITEPTTQETQQTSQQPQTSEAQPPQSPPVTQTQAEQPTKPAPVTKPKSSLVQQASAEETQKLAFSFPVEQLNSPVVKDVISQVSVPLLSLWAPVPLNSPYVSENLNPKTTTNLYTLALVLALTGVLVFRKKPKEAREELADSVIFRLKQIN